MRQKNEKGEWTKRDEQTGAHKKEIHCIGGERFVEANLSFLAAQHEKRTPSRSLNKEPRICYPPSI